MKKIFTVTTTYWLVLAATNGQIAVPAVHSHMYADSTGMYVVHPTKGDTFFQKVRNYPYTYQKIARLPKGTANGVEWNFEDTSFQGTIYYGLIKTEGIRFPQPVFFKRNLKIQNGRAKLNIKKTFRGKYDFVDWEKTGKLILGYRVVDANGQFLYDGKVNLKGTGPFTTDLTLTEGPFVQMLTDTSVVISLRTSSPTVVAIQANGKMFYTPGRRDTTVHEILITGLSPATQYSYTVFYGDWKESYAFETAPRKGSRTPFTWAFASDSRSGQGGGERSIYGTNAYILKKMTTLALQRGAKFFQFTGDMIDGYKTDPDVMNLEYANFKNAVRYYWHYAPMYIGMGNHEALMHAFDNRISVDRFPFSSASSEALFAQHFVNPLNGPLSEDGESYDPNPDQMDFPSYKENVYYYIYDNVAVIVMNSNYWYAPSTGKVPLVSGNVHGYIMDAQLKWLDTVVQKLEADPDIDHVFVTMHTPAFPNGGHARDDMWYHGNNDIRPYINGQPHPKGIIERRDELLDIVVNRCSKCVSLLHGDEHNYSRLILTSKTPIYPPHWDKKRLRLSRPFTQITNGAAGAPYYAQEQLPWSDDVQIFSTLNALVLFHVKGKRIDMEVVDPDTFAEIERVRLR